MQRRAKMMNFPYSVASPFDPLHPNVRHARVGLPLPSHPSRLHSREVFLWREVEISSFTLVSE
jgi:hypothetical protein